MANTTKWVNGASSPASPVGLLTTELNSLADNTACSASNDYNNSAGDVLADLFLHLASFSPGTNPYVSIYLLESLDGGTNYPSATGSVLRNQPNNLLVTIPLDTTAATAQDVIVRGVPIPNAHFKVVLDNQTGAALAASGNTLKIGTSNINLNG